MSVVRESHGIPETWQLVPLKELGVWSGGGTPSKAKPEFWSNGSIPWVSPKDMKTDHITDSEDHITWAAVEGSATKLIPAGSVLLVTRSGILSHTLPVAITTIPVTVNQDLKTITPKVGVLPEYVAWALRCFAREVLNTCSKQGTTVASIETTALHRFEIPVAPLDQQKLIVEEIEKQFSRLDEAVANLKRVKANLKRYRASVLKAAVEGRLVELEAELARREGCSYETGEQLLQRILIERREKWSGRGKYKEPAAPDISNLPELPEGWVWATYEQVSRLQLGRQRAPKYHSGPNMRPYLRVQNVFEDRIDLSDVMEMDFPPDDFAKYQLNPGDLLLNEGQSPELLGRPAIYRGELPGSCFTNTLIRFQAIEGIRVEFALLVSRNNMHAGRFVDEGTITTNIAHLSIGRLAKVEFPLPPFAEQLRIVAEVDCRLSLLRETEAQVDANLKRAEKLKQAILSRAFSGGLVPGGEIREGAA